MPSPPKTYRDIPRPLGTPLDRASHFLGKNRTGMTVKASLLAATMLLTACNGLARMAAVGDTPDLAPVTNVTQQPGYVPVSMPMPEARAARRTPNSLWRPGSRAFFKDLRASDIGDIVTVVIEITDEASINNSTTRTRTNVENLDIDALLGFEQAIDAILPEAVAPADILATDSNSSNVGTGAIDRDETINLQIAAVVTQVLPNGNLVIHGKQETRVNFEVRELQIAGVIRPQDVTTTNTISYNQIAEARLAYGGRGHITDVQQPRYGSQVIDILMPF